MVRPRVSTIHSGERGEFANRIGWGRGEMALLNCPPMGRGLLVSTSPSAAWRLKDVAPVSRFENQG